MEPHTSTSSWFRSASDALEGLRQSVRVKDILVSGSIHFVIGVSHLMLNCYILKMREHVDRKRRGHMSPTFLPGVYFILTSLLSCCVLMKRKHIMALIYCVACFISGVLSSVAFVNGMPSVLEMSFKIPSKPVEDILIVILSFLEVSASLFGLTLSSLFVTQDDQSTVDGSTPQASLSVVQPRQRFLSIEISGSIMESTQPSLGDFLFTTSASQHLVQTSPVEAACRMHRYRRRFLQRRRWMNHAQLLGVPGSFPQVHLSPPTYLGEASTNEPPPPYDQNRPSRASTEL